METPGNYDSSNESPSQDPRKQLEQLVNKFKDSSKLSFILPETSSLEGQATNIIQGLNSELQAIKDILNAYGIGGGKPLQSETAPAKLEELIRKLTDAATDYSRLVEWCIADYASLAVMCYAALMLNQEPERNAELKRLIGLLEIQIQILKDRKENGSFESLRQIYERGIGNTSPEPQPDDLTQ